MTADEFIAAYCARSEPPVRPEMFRKYLTALPCFCGEPICEGWAAIPNNPDSIAHHMRVYGHPREVSNHGKGESQ